MKILVGTGEMGLSLSKLVDEEVGRELFETRHETRVDPDVIAAVERLGNEASRFRDRKTGKGCVEVLEIPDGAHWKIVVDSEFMYETLLWSMSPIHFA